MSNKLTEKYPHITFNRKDCRLTESSLLLLGECDGLVKAICLAPILPEYREELLNTALIKGAQATTAIEGNTLTEEEVKKVKEGKDLSLSQKYMQDEVKNILMAFSQIFGDLVIQDVNKPISPDLIKGFHRIIGSGLGEHLDAIPGRFREDNRTVGNYKCPDYKDVEDLMNDFCDWLKRDFHYWTGKQKYTDVIVQAIVAHVYLEWIHPFGDGNGRTGRLLEFYILARGKTPDIASHILSNHYNLTRPEYYRQLSNATSKRNLSQFIDYAFLGFRDGLEKTLTVIQNSQMKTTWRNHVYDLFERQPLASEKVMIRRRKLVLELPPDKSYTVKEIILATPGIAMLYGKADLSERQVARELDELVKLELLKKEDEKFRLNIDILSGLLPLIKP